MARSPEESVRDLMGAFFSDADGIGEVREDLRRVAATHPARVQRELEALEALLAKQTPKDFLAQLVGWEGNWVLDDPSDEGARAFLVEVADMLREIIAEAPPSAARRARRQG